MPSLSQPDHPAAHADARQSRWRLVGKIALGLVAMVFALWLILFVTKGRFLKHPFERTVGAMIDRSVSVTGDFQLYFAPFQIKFYVEGLTVTNPAWASKPNLFVAKRIDTRIAPLSLIFGKRHLYWLDLTDGVVNLEWNASHDRNSWTFSDEKGGEPLAFPRIDQATVTGSAVHYRDPRMQLLADLDIDTIRSTNARIGKAVEVQGTGRLRDTPFRVTARLLTPNATANRGKNKLTLRAWAANNIIDVSGTLPSIADIENVPLVTRAQGRDLSTLLEIIGVAIPRTRRYVLRVQMVQNDTTYHFTRLTGTFGRTDVAGALTLINGDRVRLESTLATRELDIVDAAPFIGYNPDIVATQGAVAAAAATGAASQHILPDAALPIETMQRFDAQLKWTIAKVKSRNLPISNVALTLALDRGKLSLSPLTFAMARGNVASDIIFDTRVRPAADSYDIRLAPTPMAQLLAGYGVAEAGTTGTVKGRIQLKGRGDTIHDSLASASGRIAFIIPHGSFWTRNIQLSELDLGTFAYKMFQGRLKEPVQINCGLIGFTVRNGVAAADPILIDTRKNVIAAKGGFNFETEAIDLSIKADGKKFSLISAQSPVRLGGNFANPSLDVISPELLSRAGVGLGLALVGTPLAGILAFVDVGDAKSAACGPILSGATAAAQRTRDAAKRK